ncbi:MAG: putative peptidase [Prokaryotic dsDNA virus sp.]|nr:MAG: putative peptidase [Prokaryotic dsDNA virus sp.]|tara:strand:+ start:3213 stop:3845 length:633 start_codon:yes stop_codon:yes gene_type:complete
MAKKKKKKKKKYYKITELVISDSNEELAIDAISLVTDPAIEVDFVYFNKGKNNLTLAKIDEEKRMLVSPALIPNKNIYRYNAQTDQDYYVFFSKETVRKASEMYLKHNNHHKATYQHEERVSGVLTVESWIKEDDKYDKSIAYGFDLPIGTWFVKMRIDNDDMWERIKSGELKGLSIEGYFVDKMEMMTKNSEISDEDLLNSLAEILKIK